MSPSEVVNLLTANQICSGIPENKYMYVCRLSHLCIGQVMRIPIHCDAATAGISDAVTEITDWILNPVFTHCWILFIFKFCWQDSKMCLRLHLAEKMSLLATLGQSAGGCAWLHYMTCIWKDTINNIIKTIEAQKFCCSNTGLLQ